MGLLFFCVDFFLVLSSTRFSSDLLYVGCRVRSRNCLFFTGTCGVCVALIFDFLYCAFCLVCNRSVSCVQCCLCLWIVQSCLWSFCILCPVFPMSMDCPVLFVIVLYLVPSVANVYELSSLVFDHSVSCAQCCLYLWIVQSWFPYWFSVTFMYKQLVSIFDVNFQLNIHTCRL